MDGCCDECRRLAARPLPELFLQLGCDHRVATLVVLAVNRVIDRLRQQAGTISDGGQHVTLKSRDESLTSLYGTEDALSALHQGSRTWATLTSFGHQLRLQAGAHVAVRCNQDTSQDADAVEAAASSGLSSCPDTPAAANLQGSDARAPCSGNQTCIVHRMSITWDSRRCAAMAKACGSLLRSWYPLMHAATPNPRRLCSSSTGGSGGIDKILGSYERQLAAWLLRLQQGGTDSAAASAPSQPCSGLNSSQHGLGDGEGGTASLGSPPAAQGVVGSGLLLSALPDLIGVQWQPFGNNPYQGSAFLTFTNGSGVYLHVCIRSVPLFKTGGKARALTLSWPGRLGQAAKAAKGPPGHNEDQAVQRRKQKRYAVAQQAVQAAERLRCELPQGAVVFAALCTSEVEGVQVAAAKSKDKPYLSALLHLLLAFSVEWPKPDEDAGLRRGKVCRRCGQELEDVPGQKQGGGGKGKRRRHRCKPGHQGGQQGWAAAWASGSWWPTLESLPSASTIGTSLAFVTAVAVCYMLVRNRTWRVRI